MAQLNRGDADAFDQLYSRYKGWVFQLALRLTRQEADALDVLQETFSYVVRKFPGFELRARFTTFLYPVVRHLSLSHIERRRRWQADTDTPLDSLADSSPANVTPAIDEIRVLRQAIERLPERQRSVLLLRFLDGLSVAQVSEALAVPEGTVKSRLHHALGQLRQMPELRRLFTEENDENL